jgi:hypothetical protein
MASDVSSNVQSQFQQQAITISVESAGDPDLERRIFGQVHSAGRQLSNLAAVIEVLLTAQQAANPAFAQAGPDQKAVETFRKMQADILRAKSTIDPDRLISHLDDLRRVDATAFAALRDRLSAWLYGK